MWLEIITDTKFFEFLRSIDDDLAEAVRREGCVFCEGPLHQANYTRKPRGGCEQDGSIRRSPRCSTSDAESTTASSSCWSWP